MNLEHVFAKSAGVVQMPGGYPVTVAGGSHWLADDPVVLHRPDLFTADCRYGLSWSGEPPHCLTIPPDDDDEPAVRGRPRAARAASR